MREKASYGLRKVRENLLDRGTDGLRSSVYCLAGNGAAFGTDPCGGQECISALSLIKISTIRFCRALSSVPDIGRLLCLFADRSPPWHCCRVQVTSPPPCFVTKMSRRRKHRSQQISAKATVGALLVCNSGTYFCTDGRIMKSDSITGK
jgi:hypothetical protein